jgi:hypothetical protein
MYRDLSVVTASSFILIHGRNPRALGRATLHGFAFAEKAVLQITVTRPFLSPHQSPKALATPAVSDIIVRPNLGTCCFTGTSKTTEHGSLNDDNRKVTCIVSNPSLKKTQITQQVSNETSRTNDLEGVGSELKRIEGSCC